MTEEEYRNELRALSASGEGMITQHDARNHGYAYADLSSASLEPEVFDLLSAEKARQMNVLPVKLDGANLWVGMEIPPNPRDLERLALETKCRVIPVAIMPAALQLSIAFYYPATPEQT